MRIAEGIRKYGFRSWHERELLLTFGWLALALVFAVMAFGALERLLYGGAGLLMARSALLLLAAGIALLVTLRRFVRGMAHSQHASSQALCEGCGEFGRLSIVNEDRDGHWLRVRCRGCEHEWVIENP